MITIFCDFCQFSAKKLAFFSKTNVMITIFAKTSRSLSKKNANFFANFFVENILKIITSVPVQKEVSAIACRGSSDGPSSKIARLNDALRDLNPGYNPIGFSITSVKSCSPATLQVSIR
jgi:hypothetical protein